MRGLSLVQAGAVCSWQCQHSTAQHSTAQHSTTQPSIQQHSAKQHSIEQHNAKQHSSVHNVTQHSIAQHRLPGTVTMAFAQAGDCLTSCVQLSSTDSAHDAQHCLTSSPYSPLSCACTVGELICRRHAAKPQRPATPDLLWGLSLVDLLAGAKLHS